MLKRHILAEIRRALSRQPAVVLLGPRQVGKTTLAHQVAANSKTVYLDLESAVDRAKMVDATRYLDEHADTLVVLDEVQRLPRLFEVLRGRIDAGRRVGQVAGRFLLLGSASLDLLQQSSESLAGRVRYFELAPFDVLEIGSDPKALDRLWLRGG